jgi:hypothetical protein
MATPFREIEQLRDDLRTTEERIAHLVVAIGDLDTQPDDSVYPISVCGRYHDYPIKDVHYCVAHLLKRMDAEKARILKKFKDLDIDP